MKVTIKDERASRPLIAVVGAGGCGFFIKDSDGRILYVDSGRVRYADEKTLEGCLVNASARKPVYEGDTIEIKF